MPKMITAYDNRNQPIVASNNGVLSVSYFNMIRLDKGEAYRGSVPGYETVYVVLSGRCDIVTSGQGFTGVGGRADIWSGIADSVYVSTGAEVAIIALEDHTEIAVAGGACDVAYEPFRIRPEDVVMVDVGSNETKSRRRIFHIVGTNTKGRTGNLLVSELYADEGCWAGYPPHKHDEDRAGEETAFEEVYYNRFRPDNGFGAQLVFQPDGSSEGFMVRHGDTFLIDRGYHPMATSPGHDQYVFTILVGKHQNSLIQNFKEDHRYLMDRIPGISDMRAKFK